MISRDRGSGLLVERGVVDQRALAATAPTDQHRDARLLGFGQADPHVETEGRGDLVAEVRADAAAR